MVVQSADVVTEFIEGLVETYPGLQYLDGFPQVMFLMQTCPVAMLPVYLNIIALICRLRLFYVLMS